jgi:ABC-type polar amino acid transport system ATPase subunit
MDSVVAVKNLRRVYPLAEEPVIALAGIDLTINPGEFVAVMGPSGSGKSTFMHIVGFLDRPTSGYYAFNGRDVTELAEDALADIRSREMGFVFQAYNLLPRTSAVENVELPMLYAGIGEKQRRTAALDALESVGLLKYAQHHPNQLSGGQQQRVAIARALCMQPKIMLFDEPTSALDPEMIKEVLDTMIELAGSGMTMVCVTHEMAFARQIAHRVVFMDRGEIVESGEPKQIFENPQTDRLKLFLSQILRGH